MHPRPSQAPVRIRSRGKCPRRILDLQGMCAGRRPGWLNRDLCRSDAERLLQFLVAIRLVKVGGLVFPETAWKLDRLQARRHDVNGFIRFLFGNLESKLDLPLQESFL